MSLADFSAEMKYVNIESLDGMVARRTAEEVYYQGPENGNNRLDAFIAQRRALHAQLEGLLEEGRRRRFVELDICHECARYRHDCECAYRAELARMAAEDAALDAREARTEPLRPAA